MIRPSPKKSPRPDFTHRARERAARYSRTTERNARADRRRRRYTAARELVNLKAAPPKRQATFEDRLVAAAKAMAVRAMRANVAALVEQLSKAESFAEARKRALAAYPKMDTKPLAKLVAQTNVLAKLSGRNSAKKQARAGTGRR